MKIVKIFENEILEGYEKNTETYKRAFFSVPFLTLVAGLIIMWLSFVILNNPIP